MQNETYFVVGGAGFIGGHVVDRLLTNPAAQVRIFDNFSSGRRWHIDHHSADPRFSVVQGDVKDLPALAAAMKGYSTVFHFASNPDIAAAQIKPEIDFYEGTLLTHQVLEAMRLTGAKTILYASGSGVYGDVGEVEATENHLASKPISTYGASKIAGEALISAYSFMYDLRGCAFRFGNVVGPRQTHGVGFDFLRRLVVDPTKLSILGDGKQSKSYIHVFDVIDAVLTANAKSKPAYDVFNVATGDYITVTDIAQLAVECLGLPAQSVRFEYAGGDRGWKGDVPIVRLATDHICSLGWNCRRSTKEALRESMMAMIGDIRAGRM